MCVCVYVCMCICMCDLGMSLISPCHIYGTWACSEDPVFQSKVSPADRPGDINSLSGYLTRLGTMRWTPSRVCRLNRKVTLLAEGRWNDEFCMSTETFTAQTRTGAVLNIFHLTVIYFTTPGCMSLLCTPESRRHADRCVTPPCSSRWTSNVGL